MIDYYFYKENNIYLILLNHIILIEYFLISWADEDSVTVVSQHTCQGGSNIGEEVTIRGMGPKYTGKIRSIGKFRILSM